MYLSKQLAKVIVVTKTVIAEVPRTHELSEIDIIRGANADVGILGVIVPLIEGVFSPCAQTCQHHCPA